MSYFHSKILPNTSFETALEKTTAALQTEGFGVLTNIDIQATLKKKIDADFKRYHILGACNPQFAHNALLAEDKIGLFLPCNFVVEEHADGSVEVSVVDPVASMMAVKNPALEPLAMEVKAKLEKVMSRI
ncbi:MAG: DUF302 domain-containing protein [Lewinellaceae bacterium]|nr:DUF302 domain-containing protein [Lewinellaceae bacterium]